MVELDELIRTMNSLVADLEKQDKRHTAYVTNDGCAKLIVTRTVQGMEEHTNNLPQYPLIGNLPASVLENVPRPQSDVGEDSDFTEEDEENGGNKDLEEIASPYSSHRRSQRRLTPLKPIFGDADGDGLVENDIQIIDLENMDELVVPGDTIDAVENGLTRPRDASSITEESNFEDVPTINVDEDNDSDVDDGEGSFSDNYNEDAQTQDDSDDDDAAGGRSFLRGGRGDGFVIRKKLRQKGISIVVGSSSSEEGELGFFYYVSFITFIDHNEL